MEAQAQSNDQASVEVNEITIQGTVFEIPVRYKTGHVLKENEAAALQGLLQENVRNNFAKTIKDLVKENDGKDLSAEQIKKLQVVFNSFQAEYDFGKRRVGTGGGIKLTPLQREMNRIATEKLKEVLKKKGSSWNETPADQRKQLVARLIEMNPVIEKLAESNLAQLNDISL